jgi:hypothetical protein
MEGIWMKGRLFITIVALVFLFGQTVWAKKSDEKKLKLTKTVEDWANFNGSIKVDDRKPLVFNFDIIETGIYGECKVAESLLGSIGLNLKKMDLEIFEERFSGRVGNADYDFVVNDTEIKGNILRNKKEDTFDLKFQGNKLVGQAVLTDGTKLNYDINFGDDGSIQGTIAKERSVYSTIVQLNYVDHRLTGELKEMRKNKYLQTTLSYEFSPLIMPRPWLSFITFTLLYYELDYMNPANKPDSNN